MQLHWNNIQLSNYNGLSNSEKQEFRYVENQSNLIELTRGGGFIVNGSPNMNGNYRLWKGAIRVLAYNGSTVRDLFHTLFELQHKIPGNRIWVAVEMN